MISSCTESSNPYRISVNTDPWGIVDDYCLQHGIASNSSRENVTPLLRAIELNEMKLVAQLLDYGCDVNEMDAAGLTPLIGAINLHNKKIFEFLLEKGADATIFYQGLSSLHWAAAGGDVDISSRLIEKGIPVDIKDRASLSPLFPLINVLKLPTQITHQIAQEGFGITPAMLSVHHFETIKLLLQMGASPQQVDNMGANLFLYALLSKNQETIDLIYNAGGMCGNEFFFFCSLPEAPVFAQELLNRGWDVNKIYKDKIFPEGESPLMTAVLLRNYEYVDFLLKKGANSSLGDHKGRRALDTAILHNDERMIDLLLDQGAEVQYFNDKRMSTPLISTYLHPENPTWKLKIEKRDELFSAKVLLLRASGQRFSLKQKPFTGLPQKFTFTSFVSSIHTMPDRLITPSVKLITEDLIESLHVDENTSLIDLENERCVVLQAGWVKHAVAAIFFKKNGLYWFAKGNRGARGSDTKPGLFFYNFDYNKETFQEAIKTILKNGREPSKDLTNPSKEDIRQRGLQQLHFFDEKLDTLLGLKLVHHEKMREQKSGNCGFIAAKLALRACLAFVHITNENNVKLACRSSKEIYKTITVCDRIRSFNCIANLESDVIFKDRFDFSEIFHQVALSFIKPDCISILNNVLDRYPSLINKTTPEEKTTLLYKAAFKGLIETVSWLLKKGALPSIQNALGQNALHIAAFMGHLDICELLLKNDKTLLEIKDLLGKTPLERALEGNEHEVAAYFQKIKGIDP